MRHGGFLKASFRGQCFFVFHSITWPQHLATDPLVMVEKPGDSQRQPRTVLRSSAGNLLFSPTEPSLFLSFSLSRTSRLQFWPHSAPPMGVQAGAVPSKLPIT